MSSTTKGMKALKTIIKENKHYIYNNSIFYAYEEVINNDDGFLVSIDDLSEIDLNKKYRDSDWWIEDGDICIRYIKTIK